MTEKAAWQWSNTYKCMWGCVYVCDVNGSLLFSHKNQFKKEIARSSMTQTNKRNNYWTAKCLYRHTHTHMHLQVCWVYVHTRLQRRWWVSAMQAAVRLQLLSIHAFWYTLQCELWFAASPQHRRTLPHSLSRHGTLCSKAQTKLQLLFFLHQRRLLIWAHEKKFKWMRHWQAEKMPKESEA